MKKTLFTIAAVAVLGACSSFAQGYINFAASGKAVWDDFSTLGQGNYNGATTTETFLWTASTNTPPTLGWSVGTATNATSASVTWAQVEAAVTAGWNIATNAGNTTSFTGVTTTSGVQKGGIGAGIAQIAGLPTSGLVDVVVIAWNTTAGSSFLSAEGSADLGVSAPIDNYAVGATSTSPMSSFTADGMAGFGVAPAPEPSTIALAGLGVSALVAFRRRNASK